MEGIIHNFRRGRHTISHTHMILQLVGVDTKEKAQGLVGRKVIWVSPAGKEISGTIASPHGSKGAVRAIFESGMPGQAIGTKVRVSTSS